MISSLLKLASLVCCAIVVLSFTAFVSDQAGKGSKQTVATIASADEPRPVAVRRDVDVVDPSAATERQRERSHGALRERLDDADDVLTSPFAGVSGSRSVWTQRIVGALLALLVYGAGLGFLGRCARLRGI